MNNNMNNNMDRARHLSPNQLQRIVKYCNKIKKHLNDIKYVDESEFFQNSIETCEIWCNMIIFEIVKKSDIV